MQVPGFIRGSIAPIFTAWEDDGTFDPDGQRNLLDFMVSRGGMNACYVRSGLGQAYAFLSPAEVRVVAKTVCKHLEAKVPVIVGASGIWDRNYDRRPPRGQYMDECVEIGKAAQEAGAAAVVYMVPEAIVPVHDETPTDVTLRFFEYVCGHVQLPVIVSQPRQTRPEYALSPAVLYRLAQIENVVGVHFPYSDGDYLYSLLRATAGTHCAYIVGVETVFLLGLYIGAAAVIGPGCVLNPRILNAVQERLVSGDRNGAILAQDAANRLVHASRNPQDFFNRYATQNGFTVPRHVRSLQTNPYGEPDPPRLSDAEFNGFKQLLEKELAAFAQGG